MRIDSDRVIYAFHPQLRPVTTVASGDVVTVATLDALGGQISKSTDTLDCLDFGKVNPATGPMAIAGSMPGDSLKVDILDIRVKSPGIVLAVPGLGVLGDLVTTPETTVIDIESSWVEIARQRLPIRPMIGVIGVATQSAEIPCGTPGAHGGNMDTKDIGPGSTLYLPVFQTGGQLALGDVHAVMGDGEVCGTGVECTAEVMLRITLLKNKTLRRPLLKTAEEIQAIASAKTAEEAAKLAVEDMIQYIMTRQGLTFNEAYMLMSVAGNVRISQLVDPLITVRACIHKQLF